MLLLDMCICDLMPANFKNCGCFPTFSKLTKFNPLWLVYVCVCVRKIDAHIANNKRMCLF